MVRVIFIFSLLCCVLSLGLPFENILGDLSYKYLQLMGVDVNMTPFTVDMSLMIDKKKTPIYESDTELIASLTSGEERVIPANKLGLYHHKLPIILYFELVGNGKFVPEGRNYLCNSIQKNIGEKITGFFIRSKKFYDQSIINKIQVCYF